MGAAPQENLSTHRAGDYGEIHTKEWRKSRFLSQFSLTKPEGRSFLYNVDARHLFFYPNMCSELLSKGRKKKCICICISIEKVMVH